MDLHKRYAMIDVVMIEASSWAFTWAERIEARGVKGGAIDAYRFRKTGSPTA